MEYSHEVGFNAQIGKKESSNIGFTGKVSGKTKITITDTSDLMGEYFVDYCQKYAEYNPYIKGNFEFAPLTQ